MNSFDQRKKSILEKEDKASKGSWDEKMVELCNKLNDSSDYYTTSSCSGKAVIMEEKIGKDGTYYLWTSHDLINFDDFRKVIDGLNIDGLVKFKIESPILFVCCRDVDAAKNLLKKSFVSGFKQSGIVLTDKLLGVEIRSGEKLEFPLSRDGEILVSCDFLKEVVENSNFKFERGWGKIEKLLELVG